MQNFLVMNDTKQEITNSWDIRQVITDSQTLKI